MTLAISTSTLPAGVVGKAYSKTVVAAGGVEPYTWSVDGSGDALPSGLSLNTGTGAITGTPTVAGRFNIVLKVVDDDDAEATKSFTLRIHAAVDAYPVNAELVLLTDEDDDYETGGTPLGKVTSRKPVSIHREMEHETKQVFGGNFVNGSVIAENVVTEFILIERNDYVMAFLHPLTYDSESGDEGGLLEDGYQWGHPVKPDHTFKLLMRPLKDDGSADDESRDWFLIPFAFPTSIGPKQWAREGMLLEACVVTVMGYLDEETGRNHYHGPLEVLPELGGG